MPNITVNTECLRDHEQFRLRVLACKARMRTLGVSDLKPIYEYRHGKLDNKFYQAWSLRQGVQSITERLEAICDDMEAGQIKKAIHQPGDVSFGREAQKEAS